MTQVRGFYHFPKEAVLQHRGQENPQLRFSLCSVSGPCCGYGSHYRIPLVMLLQPNSVQERRLGSPSETCYVKVEIKLYTEAQKIRVGRDLKSEPKLHSYKFGFSYPK